MLRASSKHTGQAANVEAIAGMADSGLPLGTHLVALAEAAVDPRGTDLSQAREQLRSAGGTATMNDAAAVIANFEMMTRVADTTGAAVDEDRRERLGPMIQALGATTFETVRWG